MVLKTLFPHHAITFESVNTHVRKCVMRATPMLLPIIKVKNCREKYIIFWVIRQI